MRFTAMFITAVCVLCLIKLRWELSPRLVAGTTCMTCRLEFGLNSFSYQAAKSWNTSKSIFAILKNYESNIFPKQTTYSRRPYWTLPNLLAISFSRSQREERNCLSRNVQGKNSSFGTLWGNLRCLESYFIYFSLSSGHFRVIVWF